MGEAISSTNPPQENASGGILQEGNRPPGKDDAACQPKAQGIVLRRSTQPKDQPEVLPLTTVDTSSFSPNRLTVHSDSPYDKHTIPATHFKQRGF
jgi:hypothetical protein